MAAREGGKRPGEGRGGGALERGCSKQVHLLSVLEGTEVWACADAFCIPGHECIQCPLN